MCSSDLEPREKRERKATVEVYSIASPTKKEFVIPEGAGTKVGDIPNVEFALGKFRSDDEFLKTVHRIMFGTPGKATIIKKNIRAFSGLPEGDEKAKSRAEDILKRAFATTLNALLDLFDLPRGSGEDGKKEAKEKRIFDWLIKPAPSGNKNLKEAADAKREKAAKKRDRVAAKKDKAASKRSKVSSGKLPDDVKGIKAELNALAARQAALLKKLEKAVEGGAKKKAAPKKKEEAAESDEEEEEEEASDSEEEEEEEEAEEEAAKEEEMPAAPTPEPSQPEPKTPPKTEAPSDEDLEAAVKAMLSGVDLESVSMKKIRVDLEEKFGVPLNDKKSIIKEFAQKYIEG